MSKNWMIDLADEADFAFEDTMDVDTKKCILFVRGYLCHLEKYTELVLRKYLPVEEITALKLKGEL